MRYIHHLVGNGDELREAYSAFAALLGLIYSNGFDKTGMIRTKVTEAYLYARYCQSLQKCCCSRVDGGRVMLDSNAL